MLVLEASNGFHDTANAVATVIYTHSLPPIAAVVLSGMMNFAGVLLGGVAVTYTMVELLPPDVLSPPNGNPATAMLLALFTAALVWNVATWWRGIPNSSSHCLIGSLVGIALAAALLDGRPTSQGVDWSQVWSVLRALLISLLLGFAHAFLLFRAASLGIRDKCLFEPTPESEPPALWVRLLLILTGSGVSFTHGSNDGQKAIGLIMLTVIGLMPGYYTLNLLAEVKPGDIAQAARRIIPLIENYRDDEKNLAAQAAQHLANKLGAAPSLSDIPEGDRSAIRDDVYRVDSELKKLGENKDAQAAERRQAGEARGQMRKSVEYVPWWVALSPEMKCTSRDSRSSLATTTGTWPCGRAPGRRQAAGGGRARRSRCRSRPRRTRSAAACPRRR